jgi:hypothetical protein
MSSHRTAVPAALALACALAAVGIAQPAPTAAADGLIVASDTRYDVVPEERRVRITVDAVATNVTPDSATHFFVYTGTTLALQPGATAIAASSGGFPLAVNVLEDTPVYVAVEVLFSVEVQYQQSYAFSLTFDLSDNAGDPPLDTVVRRSFIGFPVWAFASADAAISSVVIAWPDGYHVDIPFGEMRQEFSLGVLLLTARDLSDPDTFLAYVTGEREGGRTRQELTVPMANGDATLLMRAWEDDPDWLARQSEVLSAGMPALERAIGSDFPVTGMLVVSEHAYRHLGDYVGFFDPRAATIELRFDADALTTLHEAAHAWFNGNWFEDRWILEGFASYYSEIVSTELGYEVTGNELTPKITESAFQLNAWLPPTLDEPEREDYGYAASPVVATEIAALAGADGLRAVWRAVADDALAYEAPGDEPRGANDPEPESWQRLLDLLENLTAADYDPIWREWVLTAAEAPELDAREAARARFDEAMEAADDWALPRSTRLLMDAWSFSAAEDELVEAREIFDEREALAAQAAGMELEPTGDLRDAFEDDGLSAAAAEIDEQRAALAAIEDAAAALGPERTLIERVGLIGDVDPAVSLDAARAAYEGGEDADAKAEADSAVEERAAIGERGRLRIGIAAAGLLALDLLTIGGLLLRRRARGRAARTATST